MKKTIFLFVLVFAVTFAIAQNSGNIATIDQYGTNIAEIAQMGSNNDADIDQGELGSSVTNSGPQTSWLYGAFIVQIGDDNDAIIDVNTSNAGSSIYQSGNDNWAKQELNSTYHKTTNWARMGLDIDQVGNDNWANQKTIYSFGSFGVQGMMIVQTGNDNIADQLSIGGKSNVTEITQIGNNNNNPTINGNAYDVSATMLADPLSLSWTQKPTGTFTQYTNQMNGTTHMYVYGDNNNTHQYQECSLTNGQIVGDNDAFMDVYGSGNNVAQGQLGEQNWTGIDIEGDGNVVASSQLGDNNMVDIDLVGGSMNCVVGVEQIGNGHSATVFQSGVSNFAKVIQR